MKRGALVFLFSLAILSFFSPPQFVFAEVTCPAGFSNPTDPLTPPFTYKVCTAADGSGQTVRVYTGTDGQHTEGELAQSGATGQTTFTQQSEPKAVACQANGVYGQIKCAFVEVIIAMVAGIVSLFTLILDLANAAFNYAIQATIVDFGSWYNKLQDPVKKGWELFRDLANIGIIGLFVFIAISIILGLQEYGQKKLIARVVIVATLINFSFLFTIIAINSSNALATAIYNSFPKDTSVTTTSSDVKGIGDHFLKYMGVRTALQTNNTLMTQYNNPASSFFGVLSYALLVIVFTLVASFVLFYGAFLLFSRFILLIILLLLSAAAFATYLSPSLSESAWKSWWHSLLRNAFLAPVLMIFLLISINIAAALSNTGALGAGAAFSLENFVADPAKSSLWQMLFNFLAILGVLYGGMYVASQMASGAASRLALSGIQLGVGIPSKVFGLGGRWFIGGRAAATSHAMDNQMKDRAKTMATLDLKDPEQAKEYKKLRSEWMSLNRQKGRRDFLAKSSFDLMDTKPLQKLGAATGIFAGKSGQSYEKTAHAQDDKVIKEAIKAAMGNKDAEAMARKAHGEDAEGYTNAERSHKQSERLVAAAEAMRDTQKRNEGLVTRMEDAQKKLLESTSKRAEIAANTKITETERLTAIAAEDHKIASINGELRDITQRMQEIDREHGESIKTARAAAAVTKKALDTEKGSIASTKTQLQARSSAVAQDIGRMRSGGPITRFWRTATGGDLDSGQSHHVVETIKGRTRGDLMDKVKGRKNLKEASGEAGGHAAPAAPAAGDAHPPAH